MEAIDLATIPSLPGTTRLVHSCAHAGWTPPESIAGRGTSSYSTRCPCTPTVTARDDALRAIVTGAWRHPAGIHILEHRTTLLGLRRSAQMLSHRDTLVLAVGDDLAEILFDEKGRCRDRETNALVRRAAGLCAASGVVL